MQSQQPLLASKLVRQGRSKTCLRGIAKHNVGRNLQRIQDKNCVIIFISAAKGNTKGKQSPDSSGSQHDSCSEHKRAQLTNSHFLLPTPAPHDKKISVIHTPQEHDTEPELGTSTTQTRACCTDSLFKNDCCKVATLAQNRKCLFFFQAHSVCIVTMRLMELCS